ncbi:hypothetical protein CWD77_05965 [Rhodohalobacter barkolensis]|uniref:Uncharacterized protein n=1 Tax=Rhodohalobacter barkolensis TaxID=2053187 RepID=A0A2N0VLD9_9BACT|nr:hypothetical protein CWD77_05965 [Rhodohalobacter barkolensis]
MWGDGGQKRFVKTTSKLLITHKTRTLFGVEIWADSFSTYMLSLQDRISTDLLKAKPDFIHISMLSLLDKIYLQHPIGM